MSQHEHIPVLRDRVLERLGLGPGETVLDATVGLGGHAAAIVPRLGPGGRLVGLDLDPGCLERARAVLSPLAERHGVSVELRHRSFREARAVLDSLGLEGVDGLVADLGFASTQMADPQRGLSFTHDGPLDMRLNPDNPTTAATLVNETPQRELADLIFAYGEERLSRKIARKIVETRREAPIQTTGALAQLVRRAYGPAGRKSRIDPATRTFQALRIAVNGELAALEALLADLPGLMKPGGRVVMISFHSLEDRRVKHTMMQLAREERGTRLTRKPITADEAEVAANPRSRSAKLRAFEFQDRSGEATTDRPRTGL